MIQTLKYFAVVSSVTFIAFFSTINFVFALSWHNLPSSEIAKSTFRDVKQKWTRHNSSISFPVQGVEQTLWYTEDDYQYFEYLPLADRQFRILQVTCELPGKRFRFELVHVSLDDLAVPYVAVSYSWGGNGTHSTISNRNRQHLNLTESVSFILDSILDEGESVSLWIDALCINQKYDEEKNHQVRLMREIYQHAQQVVISLGKPTDDSDLAMDFIEPLKIGIEELHDNGMLISEEAVKNTMGLDFPEPTWTALSRLLRRSWFSRIWVIQEVAVGVEPVFILGDRAVKWNSMTFVAAKIFDQGLLGLFEYDHNNPFRRQLPPEGIRHIAEMHEARSIKQNKEQESFQEILMGFHHFDATDSRDKIFALLGLANHTEDKILDPNYTATTEEVYLKTARHLLLRDESIFILHRAGIGFPRAITGLPSWVPDWSSISIAESVGAIYKKAGYEAAAKSLSKVKPGSRPQTLVFEGVLVDVVEKVGSVRNPAAAQADDGSEEALKYNSEVITWLCEAEDMTKDLKGHVESPSGKNVLYFNRETMNEALCRTLVANNTLVPRSSGIWTDCDSWGRYRLGLQENSQDRMSDDMWKRVDGFNDDCTFASMGKRFFITQNGFMGLTSPGTQSNDSIAIFLGGKTPFIIRADLSDSENQPVYTLVSEAYIHGLMNGEGLDMSRVREIELR